MKTFLISLARQEKRREKVLSDLNRLSLDYEVFDAVDGYTLPEEILNRVCDQVAIQRQQPYFTKGLIGCCLSHYEVYKKIIEQNLPYAFIIEDDACLPKDIVNVLASLEPQLKVNEVVLLYYQSSGLVLLSKTSAVSLSKKFSLVESVSGNLNCTGAYVITREACIILSKEILPVHVGPDDWKYFLDTGLSSLRLVYPRMVKTYNFKSTISDITNFNSIPIVKLLVRLIERFKLFPFYQILKLRRAYRKNVRSNQFYFSDGA